MRINGFCRINNERVIFMFNCKKTAAFIAGLILCASSAASPLVSFAAIDGALVEDEDGSEATTDAAEENDYKYSGDFKYSLTSEGNVRIEGCTSGAESLVIPDTLDGKKVTELGRTALGTDQENNPYLSVTIPASIKYISADNPFMYCTYLQEIKVESGNTEYTAEDDVLYSKDRKTLLSYPCCKEGDSFTVPEGVTTIGFAAFYNAKPVSLEFPSSLAELDAFAFGDMTNLKSADLSKTAVTEISNYAFSQCSALENVIFPSALTVIGGGAFAGCTGIKDIEFPESLTSIGQYAFVDAGLDTAIIPDSVQDIGYSAFGYRSSPNGGIIPMNDFTLVGSIGGAAYTYSTDSDSDYDYKNDFTFLTREQYTQEKEIMDLETVNSGDYTYAIKNNNTLLISCRAEGTTVNVPSEIDGNTITVIYPGCFSLCQAEEIVLPDTVTEIRESAFLQCPELKTITVPESVKKIGEAAFAECAKLETIEFKGAETIGRGIFSGCGALKKVTAAGCLKEWQDEEPFVYCPMLEEINIGEGDGNYSSDNGILYSKDKTTLLCYPANKSGDSFTVPDSVKEIGISAFLNNKNIKSVKMSKVEKILAYAFEGCSNLSSVEVSECLNTLEADAFYNCTSLKSLRLYENLKTIGPYAFGYYKDHSADSSDADSDTDSETEDDENGKDAVVEGFKLYAPEGSEAYKFAKANGIEVIANTTEIFGKNMDTRFLYALIGIIGAAVLTVLGILIGKSAKKKKAAAEKAKRKEKAAELRSKKKAEEEAAEDEAEENDDEYEDDNEEDESDED